MIGVLEHVVLLIVYAVLINFLLMHLNILNLVIALDTYRHRRLRDVLRLLVEFVNLGGIGFRVLSPASRFLEDVAQTIGARLLPLSICIPFVFILLKGCPISNGLLVVRIIQVAVGLLILRLFRLLFALLYNLALGINITLLGAQLDF